MKNILVRLAGDSDDSGVLVMGGYGHRHIEELLAGGFTQGMLNQRRFSLFLHH